MAASFCFGITPRRNSGSSWSPVLYNARLLRRIRRNLEWGSMLEGVHNALLIYNLTSGRRRHRRFAEVEEATRILKSAGIAAELAPTTSRGSATSIARHAVAQNRDLVIVCGGDGTINEVVNGLAGSAVPMAVLPAGTANILAKELGIPWDISAAARLIPNSDTRRIALGSVMNVTPHGDV